MDISLLDYLRNRIKGSWHYLLAVGLALAAQTALEPPRDLWLGVLLYAGAAGCLLWGFRKDAVPMIQPQPVRWQVDSTRVRLVPLLMSAPLILAAYWYFSGNRFDFVNLVLWFLCGIVFLAAFWSGSWRWRELVNRTQGWFEVRSRVFVLSDKVIAMAFLAGVILFFRAYRLEAIPPEMYSDHAEKLLDVAQIIRGQFLIFFERNTGREGLQMYLTAAIAQLLGTGLTFSSLKIGTLLAGVFTIPFVYLLGKEYGGERVGWYATFFVGVAYWLNTITRVALRYTFYPSFVAPALYYLVKGIRRGSRNDFILSGFFLGLGLHGYSAYRIVPLLILIAVLLYLFHTGHRLRWTQTIWHFSLLGMAALILFLPLLRYILESPDHAMMFFYRSLTRVSGLEQPLAGPVWRLGIEELWAALVMFWWDNGDIWVHSVRSRPALDVVMGGLMFIGLGVVMGRYVRRRNWMDLFLLIAPVVLLLPSALSLAFPGENPSLNRTGGAIIPAVIFMGIALETLYQNVAQQVKGRLGRGLAVILAGVLLIWTSANNYQLYFKEYATDYRMFILNTSEVGEVVHSLALTVGTPDRVWVVPYPHWVDTRLVGMEAGFPLRDFALWRGDLSISREYQGAKAFVYHRDDEETLAQLTSIYPQGINQIIVSAYGRNFGTFFVPP